MWMSYVMWQYVNEYVKSHVIRAYIFKESCHTSHVFTYFHMNMTLSIFAALHIRSSYDITLHIPMTLYIYIRITSHIPMTLYIFPWLFTFFISLYILCLYLLPHDMTLSIFAALHIRSSYDISLHIPMTHKKMQRVMGICKETWLMKKCKESWEYVKRSWEYVKRKKFKESWEYVKRHDS